MATQNTRVASWYWIVSAILTPFLLLATIAWFYYAGKSQQYKSEAERIAIRAKADAAELEQLIGHMKEVSAATGFDMGDPVQKHLAGAQSKAPLPGPIAEQEPTKPYEDRNAVYNLMRDAEKKFYGDGDKATGEVHKYIAARMWLDEFDTAVHRYIVYKSYQYYTVPALEPGADGTTVGDLTRPIMLTDKGHPVPTQEAMDAAWTRYGAGRGEPPIEKFLHAPTNITMELVLGMQFQLISDLLTANHHQHALLFGEVAGDIGQNYGVGYKGEEKRLKEFRDKFGALASQSRDRMREANQRLETVSRATEDAVTATNNNAKAHGDRVTLSGGRIDQLAQAFEAERATHQTDAEAFEKLTRNIPRIKLTPTLEKRDADGEIMYSDYDRRVVHINLGSADNVRAGQRFEVWRMSGREQDMLVGVIEIMRTLNRNFSVATVLSLVDNQKPVHKSDKIVSRIWHDGRFLAVALHGSFEPPTQAYSKERLAELLKQAGCRVVDKVQPGTDLAITGSNLLGDDWYRKAKDDLRFEALREEDVRIYIDPR